MGSVFEGLLNNTFAVYRRDRIADGQGGWTLVWAAVGVAQGRLRPTTSQERLVASAEQQQVTHVLYTLAGADVARGDRVYAPGGPGGSDTEVEVLGIREPSLAGHHWEIDCLERQREASLAEGS